MAGYQWDYHKLPDSEVPRVQKALDEADLLTLFDIYYDYKLGATKYCCPDPKMFTFFLDLIDKRKL